MKILKQNQLDEAAKLLKEGKVIAFPTETVYGLGVVYDDKVAYDSLCTVKRRPPEKPFTLMLADVKDVEKYADLNNVAKALVNAFMPGQFTLITKAKEGLNEVEFLEKIKEYEKTYNFRIFLFILKNNTLFDLQLEDQVDYSVHFRNESKKEIDAIKQEIGEMKKDIADVKTRIDNLDKKFDEFSDMIKRALGIKNEEKNLEKK